MSRQAVIIGMLAETPLHPGAGASEGVVDLPVSREAKTDYPVIPGSSLKGSLRDRARQEKWDETDTLFGKPDSAGFLSISDARILLLPVRSLTGLFQWVTCPYILERLQRDFQLAGTELALPLDQLSPKPQKVIVSEKHAIDPAKHMFLEELQFSVATAAAVDAVAEAIAPLIKHEQTRKRLSTQLVVVHDDDFSYFARHGLPVVARNKLDRDTKTSENLWYEEHIPSDALFYFMVNSPTRRSAELETFVEKLTAGSPYLQVGGNETVGQGWTALEIAYATL